MQGYPCQVRSVRVRSGSKSSTFAEECTND